MRRDNRAGQTLPGGSLPDPYDAQIELMQSIKPLDRAVFQSVLNAMSRGVTPTARSTLDRVC